MSTDEGRAFLQIEGLAKTFPGAAEPVFDSVNFAVRQGEFVCIIGHSGCGKTTILNVLAGLDTASAGHVFMDGREIAGPSLERGVVFQGHALMPWLTVRRNIAFAVRSKWPAWPAVQVNQHVEKYVAMVGLAAAIDKKPAALSGGMKQRVGIARAAHAAARRTLRCARRADPRHDPGRVAAHLRRNTPDGVHDHARRG
jgi:nitrate/nitrite transport system ATP-binding protein